MSAGEGLRPSAIFAKEHLKYPVTGVEVGVCEAYNAEVLLFGWKELVQLHLVDNVRDGLTLINTGINKLRFFGERVTWHLISSEDASHLFEKETLDYVYIDGCHSYEAVKDDIRFWFPKVKIGGVLGGHDVGTPGVDKAIKEMSDNGYLRNLQIVHPDWWVYKE